MYFDCLNPMKLQALVTSISTNLNALNGILTNYPDVFAHLVKKHPDLVQKGWVNEINHTIIPFYPRLGNLVDSSGRFIYKSGNASSHDIPRIAIDIADLYKEAMDIILNNKSL